MAFLVAEAAKENIIAIGDINGDDREVKLLEESFEPCVYGGEYGQISRNGQPI